MADDVGLLEAWRAGDNAAGDSLIRRHFDSVYRFFRTKLDRGVEDMVQRTFLGCVEGRDRIENLGNFRAYLLAIARRQLWTYLRTKRRRGSQIDLDEVSVHDLYGSPSAIAAQRQEQKLLLMALRRLPLPRQIVLELHYWEGMRVAEIAEVLDAPAGTVKRWLFEARNQLRRRLEECATDEGLLASTVGNLDEWARELGEIAAVREPDNSEIT